MYALLAGTILHTVFTWLRGKYVGLLSVNITNA
jgi:hypothetical protein